MEKTTLKKNIINGTLWSTGGQIASLFIGLIANIWLARILSPDEFGQVGVVMFFIIVANVLTEGGLVGALVRKKDATPKDYSTVFICNLVISVLCFLLLVAFSGKIADFYKDQALQSLLIVASPVLIINAFQITQLAKLISDLKFKKRSILRLISTIIGSIVGIISAYCGTGVWSLIYMQLGIAASLTILLWITEGLFFSIQFSKVSFKKLYSFGVNTTLASLLDTAFDNIYQLILGKYFSFNQVGYYYQAKKLQDVPGGVINMVTQTVIFSSLAKLQDDKVAFTKAYNKITLLFLVVLGFISCLIYVYSEQIILIVYGKKWLGAIFYMQLLTIASFFYLQEKINRVIFKVFDKTNQILYLEFFKKGVQIISIIVGVIYLNIYFLIVGFVITSIIGYFINYFYSRKILEKDGSFEFVSVIKVVMIASICIFVTCEVNNCIENIYIKLFSLPLLIILYWGGLYILRIYNIIDFIKNFKK